jgi:hypothetical protein
MIGFILALVVGTPSADASSHPVVDLPVALPSRRQVRSAILACGLPRSSVQIQWEQDIQDDVVWISRNIRSLSKRQINCVARTSVDTYYEVYFRNYPTEVKYNLAYGNIRYAVEVEGARKWLIDRDIISKVPALLAHEQLADYADAVEQFCGIKTGAFLAARDEHTLVVVEGRLGHPTPNGIVGSAVSEGQFDCVENATAAADLRSHGVSFGFEVQVAPAVRDALSGARRREARIVR